MKYNYSIKRKGLGEYNENTGCREALEETFQVVNCDSFDEAIKAVEKGVYERELKEEESQNKKSTLNPNPPTNPTDPLDESSTTATTANCPAVPQEKAV